MLKSMITLGLIYRGVHLIKQRIGAMSVILALSLTLSACIPTTSAVSSISTVTTSTGVHLRDLALARNLSIGAAVNVSALQHDRTYAELLTQQLNMVTPENVMKFNITEPGQDIFDFTQADALVAFAQAHRMQVRGHNLVWDEALPLWLTAGHFSKPQLQEILQNHISTVVQRFRSKVHIWDVVNEAIDDNGHLRKSIWLDTLGPDYIAQAFRWAHEADPQAHLFYNDYGAEGLGAKSEAVYKLVKSLVDSGVPIYGVGLQMHVSIFHTPSEHDVLVNMQRLAALGLKVQITEMDVSLRQNNEYLANPTPVQVMPAQLNVQARIYHDMLAACLSTNACEAFVMWGLTDRYSWLNGDGLIPNHADAPLIYDEHYQPKPAFTALANALGGP